MKAWPSMPGVPAAGHVTARGFWHSGRIEGCPKCEASEPKAAPGPEAVKQMVWVIEVCRTCGRVAQWPYCEHRDQAKYGDPPWCVAVTVRATPGQTKRLRKMMDAAKETHSNNA